MRQGDRAHHAISAIQAGRGGTPSLAQKAVGRSAEGFSSVTLIHPFPAFGRHARAALCAHGTTFRELTQTASPPGCP